MLRKLQNAVTLALMAVFISIVTFTARAEIIITGSDMVMKGRIGDFSQNGVKFYSDRYVLIELDDIKDARVDPDANSEQIKQQQSNIDRLEKVIDKDKYLILDVKKQIQQLITEKEFDVLDNMANGFLANKNEFPSGQRKLYYFFTGIKSDISNRDIANYLKRVRLIKEWIDHKPDSDIARLALMETYRSLAWAYRGAGYGNTVSANGSNNFRDTLEQALSIGKQLTEENYRNPHLYLSLISTLNGLGAEKIVINALAMKSFEIDPSYFRTYFSATNALLPRWGGKPGEVEAFANRIAQLTEDETGSEIYFRIIRYAKGNIDDRRYVYFNFDWQTIDQGFQAYQNKYVALDKDYHLMAKLACLHGNRESARKYFALTDGQWNHFTKTVWDKPEILAQFKEWSNQETSADFNRILVAIFMKKYSLLVHLVEKYIESGEDINRTDVYGNSSLHLFIEYNMPELAQEVIMNGADVNLNNGDGYSPLQLAARNGRPELIKMLLENGANTNMKSSPNNNTAAHYAAMNGFEDTLNILLESDAHLINSLNNDRSTPLHLAAHYGHIDTISALLEYNELELNLQNINGNTPLYLAVHQGHSDVVQLLVENSADMNITNKNNYTALTLAKEQGFSDIVKYLTSMHAEVSSDYISVADRKKANELYDISIKYFTAQDFNKAKKFLLEALALNPNHHLYNHTLALGLWQFEGDLKNADEYMNKSIELNPGYVESYYWSGRINHDLGRPAVYKPLFQKYVKLAPNTHNTKGLKKSYAHLLVDDPIASDDKIERTSAVGILTSENRNILLLIVGILLVILLAKTTFRNGRRV